jgi:hypothetical protein
MLFDTRLLLDDGSGGDTSADYQSPDNTATIADAPIAEDPAPLVEDAGTDDVAAPAPAVGAVVDGSSDPLSSDVALLSGPTFSINSADDSADDSAASGSSTGAIPLPSGFTMGDPNSALYGASYYNGQKIIGNSGGYWILADGSQGPAYDPAVEDAITQNANAAYLGTVGNPGYAYESIIDPANTYTSPEVRTLLQDPEWAALQGAGPIYFDQLSPELQLKIKAIPNLYNSLIGNFGALSASVAGSSGVPTQPARYLVDGLTVDASGAPLPYDSPYYYNALADSMLQRQAAGISPEALSQNQLDMIAKNPALVTSLPPDFLKAITPTVTSLFGPLAVTPAPAPAAKALTSGGISSPLEATTGDTNGNQKVLIGALAVVLMVLAWVGLKSHGE